MRLGPEELEGRSVVGEVVVRRYRCTRCGSVVVVAPRGVLPRLRYGAVAIALALGLWTTEGMSAHEVRKHVSPFSFVGEEACRGWRSLGRWARSWPWELGPPPDGTPRERALALVQRLAGHGDGSGTVAVLACRGALFA